MREEDATLITDHAFAELGLPLGASAPEVKAAWRRLVSQWHPDRNPSAAALAKIQRINQAFEAIRLAQQAPATDAAPPAAEPTPEPTAPPAAGPSPRPSRPAIRRKLKLTLEEAAAGCIKLLRGKFGETCRGCEGAGHQIMGGHCSSCGGSGALSQRPLWFGWPSTSIECEACLGGGMARQSCPDCAGSGRCEVSYKVQVRIPLGVREGDLLHVDAPRARSDSAPAELEIQVQIAPHAFFQLDEDGTVRCEVPVDSFAWIANRRVQVPTLGGPHVLQLRRDQLVYRLAELGFPKDRRGANGDQVVTLVPLFPEPFSTDQNILLDQLIATGAGSNERLQAWNTSIKSWDRTRTAHQRAADD